MQKTSRLHRLLAVIVAVFMAVCCLPLNAFAANTVTVTMDFCEGDGTPVATETVDVGGGKEYSYEVLSAGKVPGGYELTNPEGIIYIDTVNDEIIVYVKRVETPAVEKKIIVNFNNGEGTWTDGVADADPKTFVLSSNTPDAAYSVPADVKAPDGKELVNWTNNWDSSVLNAGDTFSYNSIAAIVGNTENELYIAYTAQYADKPVQQKLNQINVQFMTNDGKELAVGYTLKAGDKNFIYDVVYDDMVPAGQVLDRWVYASTDFVKGSEISFESLAKMIGTNYDDQGTAWVTFNPVFVDKPSEGLKTIDVVFVTTDGKEVAGHYTMQANQSNFVYDSVYEGACPEGKILDHWYLNGDQSKVFAPGAAVTFEQLAAVIGDNYDEKGVAYISFTPVFKGAKSVGLNFYDEENKEQVLETYVQLPEDAIHLNTSKIELPDGYEFTSVGDLAINDGWIYVGVKCVKTLRIYWAIDNENGSFANGQPNSWTQELTWKHVNDAIELPVVNTKSGYVMNGWSVSGQQGEIWKPSLKTIHLGDKYVADDEGGIISITANIVTKTSSSNQDKDDSKDDDNSSSSNNNNNNSSTQKSTQVVKSDAPAANTAKILPQTGVTAETPVVFGVMMVAALAGAAAYLFAIRKKLN